MGLFAWLLSPLIDKRIAAFQNDYMGKHVAEVENIYRQMRGWRHDYHNHIQVIKAYLALAQYDEVGEYIGKLDEDLISVDTVLKTGNIMVDAILNSKLSLASSRKINIDAAAIVPKELNITGIDLCIIIGNLLDNAIEACEKAGDGAGRFIRVYIDILKDHLYIYVSNSTGVKIKKIGKTYQSAKSRDGHGFGLMRVDRIADKYGGYVNRQNEEGVFATEIMLPLK